MADDKPFACAATGCGMRFTNEDHLTVHKQKHQMKLELDESVITKNTLLNTSFVADQTPTPTKFLKNCEEIGLFQELSKNPFDEAFKKASENVPLPGPSFEGGQDGIVSPVLRNHPLLKVAASQLPSTSGVSMETPTVEIPLTPAEPKSVPSVAELGLSLGISKVNEVVQKKTHIPESSPSSDDVVIEESAMSSNESSEVQSQVAKTYVKAGEVNTKAGGGYTVQMLVKLPDGQTLPITYPANILPGIMKSAVVTPKVAVKPTGKTVLSNFTSTLTKQRLKATLTENGQQKSLLDGKKIAMRTNANSMSIISTASSLSDPYSTVINYNSDLQSSQFQMDNDDGNKRRRTGDPDDPDERRRKFLERNRAAAARCRHKRKAWITNLEKKSDDLYSLNNRLQAEIVVLKNEISQLKAMLLAHRECPVTKQQQAAGYLAMETIFMSGSPAASTDDDVIISPPPLDQNDVLLPTSGNSSLSDEIGQQSGPSPVAAPIIITKSVSNERARNAVHVYPVRQEPCVLPKVISSKQLSSIMEPTYIIVTNPVVSTVTTNIGTNGAQT